MYRNSIKTKRISGYICLCLIIAIVYSIITPAYVIYAASTYSTIDYDSRIADPDSSAPGYMGFSDIPWLHDGRIWNDKSVRVNTGTGAEDFNVTLSALSQSFPKTDGYVIPTDTVFIVDMSGSMYQENIAGRPRVAVLVDALNEAIDILLDANPQNRIAVVAYGGRSGGYSRAEDVLPLGRPELLSGETAYFSYRPGVTNHYVDVNTTIKITASILVQGSTPTQRGILNGANILTSATGLTMPALDTTGNPVTEPDGSPLMVTRKPNFILMTDGEPTLAWSDYLFTTAPTETSQNYGDGSYGEMGVSLLTVLTAAHRKRLVHKYYYEDNRSHTPSVANYKGGNEPVGFYTISLNDVPPPMLISAAMFPFDPADTGADSNSDNTTPAYNIGNLGGAYPVGAPTESMGELLRLFVDPEEIKFFAQFRVAFGNYNWREVAIENPQLLTLDELAFANEFFAASDLKALRTAFASITTDIQRQSYSAVTDAETGHDAFDGYLVFSDVLGKYMEFRGITGFEFDGTIYDRTGFAQSIINNTNGAKSTYEGILYQHINYGNLPGSLDFDPVRYVSASQVTELIESNINAEYLLTNNSIKYYAFANRDFAGSFFNADGSDSVQPTDSVAVVDVYPMTGTLSSPVYEGGTTDLMHITFHVVTAIKDNTIFEEIFSTDSEGNPLNRKLNTNDQIVRFYIPAALIPQRMLDPDNGDLSGNRLPVRIDYNVGLNIPLIDEGVSEAYISGNSDGDDVYFYTNQYHENETLAFFQPHDSNPFYQPGRPGSGIRGVPKSSNPTGTAGYISQSRQTGITGTDRTDIHRLGNNGRLTVDLNVIPPEPPPSPEPPVTSPEPPPGSPPDTPSRPPERAPQTGVYDRFAPYIFLLVIGLGIAAFATACIVCTEKDKKK